MSQLTDSSSRESASNRWVRRPITSGEATTQTNIPASLQPPWAPGALQIGNGEDRPLAVLLPTGLAPYSTLSCQVPAVLETFFLTANGLR